MFSRYPEGASSNPARVNVFQLTSAESDYHKKISLQGMFGVFDIKSISVAKGRGGGGGVAPTFRPD